MPLIILDGLPEGLLDTPAQYLYQKLDSSALIHLNGQTDQRLFISVLLHGNETTGWDTVRILLKDYPEKLPQKAISLFIGNITAARYGKRRLHSQQDYNRAWSASVDSDSLTEEQQIMSAVIKEMSAKPLFASIDFHNNTGKNPHYACINKRDKRFMYLASLFSHYIVYFISPASVQSMAFANFCPAVTLECGQAADENSVPHALNYLHTILELEHLHHETEKPIDLYHTMARIKLNPEYSFSFSLNDVADLCFHDHIESYNFKALESHYDWARLNNDKAVFQVIDEQEQAVFDKYFSIEGDKIYSKSVFMPSMLTTNKEIVLQDCLCYIMEKLEN